MTSEPSLRAAEKALERVGLGDRMVCPRCRSRLGCAAERCSSCGIEYPLRDGVWCLLGDASPEHVAFYSAEDDTRYGRAPTGIPAYLADPVYNFLADLPADATVVEIGSGRGAFVGAHPGHVMTDFSLYALTLATAEPRIQCDVQALPFGDGSVNAVFSVATLEHVPDPQRAVAEIDRCLAPGGRLLLFPAWYVRPWASRALAQRRYRDVCWRERFEKLTVIVRDRRPYRFLRVLPGRVCREFRLRRSEVVGLNYRRLKPNLEEYLDSDSDAYTSLDPQAVAAFFLARGYRDTRRPTSWQRILYAYEPVVMEKPAECVPLVTGDVKATHYNEPPGHRPVRRSSRG